MLAKNCTDEAHRLIAASIGVAIPSEDHQYGYLSEHHSFGQSDEVAGDYSQDLAATMLATTMGIPFDPETAWDERKELFKSSGLIIRTTGITQSATVDKIGLWTHVVAAAVFLPPDRELPGPSQTDPRVQTRLESLNHSQPNGKNTKETLIEHSP